LITRRGRRVTKNCNCNWKIKELQENKSKMMLSLASNFSMRKVAGVMFGLFSMVHFTASFVVTPTQFYHTSLMQKTTCPVKTFKAHLDEVVVEEDRTIESDRRSVLRTLFLTSSSVLAMSAPGMAEAAIDLSGLSGSQTVNGAGNSIVFDQIRSGGYDNDGSGVSRVQQLKQQQTPAENAKSANKPALSSSYKEDNGNAAVNVYVSGSARESKVGIAKLKTKFETDVLAPENSKGRYVKVQFEYPSDWLQLDRALGGIQFVDQRNGDKLYVLQAQLPSNTNLASVPKTFFGESIFGDSRSAIVRSGNTIDEYKVSYAKVISDCPEGMCSTRRRVLVKYATVTGNGYRVERRAIVDAYEIGDTAYMMVTSSNAVKFDAKGAERDTVESIVDSYSAE